MQFYYLGTTKVQGATNNTLNERCNSSRKLIYLSNRSITINNTVSAVPSSQMGPRCLALWGALNIKLREHCTNIPAIYHKDWRKLNYLKNAATSNIILIKLQSDFTGKSDKDFLTAQENDHFPKSGHRNSMLQSTLDSLLIPGIKN